jgi:hypothetical protein
MVAYGRVKNGVVVLDNGLKLPEGQEVTIVAPPELPVAALNELERQHRVLDIAPVSLGLIKRPLTADDDLLGEMLDEQQ